MLKKLAIIAIALIIVMTGGYLFINSKVTQYLQQPLVIQDAQVITIPSGANINRALSILQKHQWIHTSFSERFVRRVRPDLVNIKAGTYQLTPKMSLTDALQVFNSGKEHQFAITFVEGSRFSEWRQILDNTPYLKHTIKDESEADIAKSLNIEHDKLEGLFLAETYHFTAGESDLDILRRAHKKLMAYLDSEWQKKNKDLPLKSPYEALILASIIEKETAIESERERIASVFVNRLNKHMRLQTDPTVIYGMGDHYQGNIRRQDLRHKTPYNTYVIYGLPPTPIAMVGKNAVNAALHPEDSDYLYFVASGNGGHVFSKTLNEHNRAVRAYLRYLRSHK
ncbi:endolytic transglycosylase MltG [Vibrio sp. CAIM 722]|uniref:Endolytic murein transglycosylase n=1 Tax=Vibrio eleionomae TaxID=2653505 RepID=A0A7X4LI41_9VIBR|nr:endolytic transglycosylase MltG [Vibrio eleionomae]